MPVVVVASAGDAGARALVTRWRAAEARLLTPADLSLPGWCIAADDVASGTAVVSGEVLPLREVCAAYVRLNRVGEGDLPAVARVDRAYAAAEMTAFLSWWLSLLPGGLVNPCSVSSLAGPADSDTGWLLRASELGIPCWHPGRPAGFRPKGARALTVVGRRCLDPADPETVAWARLLAADCGAAVLRVWFDSVGVPGRFLTADVAVDVTRPDVADALLAELLPTAPVSP